MKKKIIITVIISAILILGVVSAWAFKDGKFKIEKIKNKRPAMAATIISRPPASLC